MDVTIASEQTVRTDKSRVICVLDAGVETEGTTLKFELHPRIGSKEPLETRECQPPRVVNGDRADRMAGGISRWTALFHVA